MDDLIISTTRTNMQAKVNKGLNILPNFLWLMAYNHTVDSIMRQSSNYHYAKGFSPKKHWYNYDNIRDNV